MDQQRKIRAISLLGSRMRENPFPDRLIHEQQTANPFFNAREITRAALNWSELLQEPILEEWMSHYPQAPSQGGKEVLVIAAGNIPMAGFHDFLCVLMAGFRFSGRLSSRDNLLLPFLAGILVGIEPEFHPLIRFNPGNGTHPDALIASGSTNTARYHLQDFGHLPAIIRKTRISPAVLNGTETPAQLNGLAGDILHYYGLGCRSVSSIMVPTGYDPFILAQSIRDYPDLDPNPALKNNLRYQKARLKTLDQPFIDAGHLLLVPQPNLHSPVATVNLMEYASLPTLDSWLSANAGSIQCVVGNAPPQWNPVPFGTVQQPALWDYADGIDTMDFLLNLDRS